MVAVAPDAALLDAFHAAARDFPWYRTLLRELGLDPAGIADATAFSQRCPILTKANTFDRFHSISSRQPRRSRRWLVC